MGTLERNKSLEESTTKNVQSDNAVGETFSDRIKKYRSEQNELTSGAVDENEGSFNEGSFSDRIKKYRSEQSALSGVRDYTNQDNLGTYSFEDYFETDNGKKLLDAYKTEVKNGAKPDLAWKYLTDAAVLDSVFTNITNDIIGKHENAMYEKQKKEGKNANLYREQINNAKKLAQQTPLTEAEESFRTNASKQLQNNIDAKKREYFNFRRMSVASPFGMPELTYNDAEDDARRDYFNTPEGKHLADLNQKQAKSIMGANANLISEIQEKLKDKNLSEDDKEALKYGLEFIKNTEAIANAPSQANSKFFNDYWEGVKAGFKTENIPFWGSYEKWDDARDVRKIIERGKDREYTDAEKLFLNAYQTSLSVSSIRNDLPVSYLAGQGMMESLPYMAEFIATSMIGGGALGVASKVVGQASKVGKVLNVIDKGLDISKQATMLGKVGAGAANAGLGLGKAAIQTAALPSTYANISEDRLNYSLNDRDYEFADYMRSFGDSMTEVLSERIGGAITRGASKLFSKKGSWWYNFSHSTLGKVVNDPLGVTETGEEYIGAGMNWLRSYIPIGNEEANLERRGEAEQMFTKKQLATTYLSMLPISLFGNAASATRFVHNTKKYNQSREELSAILQEVGYNKQEANSILSRVENAENSTEFEANIKVLRKIISNKRYAQDSKYAEDKGFADKLETTIKRYMDGAARTNIDIQDLSINYEKLSEEDKQKVNDVFAAWGEKVKNADQAAIVSEEKVEAPSVETTLDGIKKEEDSAPLKTQAASNVVFNNAKNKDDKFYESSVFIEGKEVEGALKGDIVLSEDGKTLDLENSKGLMFVPKGEGGYSSTPVVLNADQAKSVKVNNTYTQEEYATKQAEIKQAQGGATAQGGSSLAGLINQDTGAGTSQVESKPYPTKKDGSPDFNSMTERERYEYLVEERGEEGAKQFMIARYNKTKAKMDNLLSQQESLEGEDQWFNNNNKIKEHEQTLSELDELFAELGINPQATETVETVETPTEKVEVEEPKGEETPESGAIPPVQGADMEKGSKETPISTEEESKSEEGESSVPVVEENKDPESVEEEEIVEKTPEGLILEGKKKNLQKETDKRNEELVESGEGTKESFHAVASFAEAMSNLLDRVAEIKKVHNIKNGLTLGTELTPKNFTDFINSIGKVLKRGRISDEEAMELAKATLNAYYLKTKEDSIIFTDKLTNGLKRDNKDIAKRVEQLKKDIASHNDKVLDKLTQLLSEGLFGEVAKGGALFVYGTENTFEKGNFSTFKKLAESKSAIVDAITPLTNDATQARREIELVEGLKESEIESVHIKKGDDTEVIFVSKADFEKAGGYSTNSNDWKYNDLGVYKKVGDVYKRKGRSITNLNELYNPNGSKRFVAEKKKSEAEKSLRRKGEKMTLFSRAKLLADYIAKLSAKDSGVLGEAGNGEITNASLKEVRNALGEKITALAKAIREDKSIDSRVKESLLKLIDGIDESSLSSAMQEAEKSTGNIKNTGKDIASLISQLYRGNKKTINRKLSISDTLLKSIGDKINAVKESLQALEIANIESEIKGDGYYDTPLFSEKQEEEKDETQEEKKDSDEDISATIAKLVNVFNLKGKIKVVSKLEDLADINKEAYRRAKNKGKVYGFYLPSAHMTYIYLPDIISKSEAIKTIFHECVAHFGMREVLGDKGYDEFCDKVWGWMTDEQKERWVKYVSNKKYKSMKNVPLGTRREAADEYVAYLAESDFFGFINEKEKSLLRKIYDYIRNLFKKNVGEELTLSDREILEALYKSYNLLQSKEYAVFNYHRSLSEQMRKYDVKVGEINEGELFSKGDNSAIEQEKQAIKEKAIADGTFMKAPNGKPTNLTEDQWLHVRLKSFKDWFGDWENGPDNASKVVDENGEPKEVYHGTPKKFNIFDKEKIGSHTDTGWLGRGFYFFGANLDYARGYADGTGNIMSVFLNVRNPYFILSEEVEELAELNNVEASNAITEDLLDEGYDGVFYNGDLNEEWCAFEPNQIKSATENNGEYSNENNDIRFSKGEQIKDMFDKAVAGDLTGKPLSIGKLTSDGKRYLESISGLQLKDDIDFVLNPSDLVHIYNDHYGDNEKDKGNNIPLTRHDIRRMVDVISFPTKVVYGKDESGRKLFYFLMDSYNSSYNLLEIYADKKGNLTTKTYYKTKKGVTQRVMELRNSLLPTSETYFGTTLSDAKIPQMFELANNQANENAPRFRVTEAEDKAYLDAVAKGDMETAQRMVNEVAERTGYNSSNDYQGSLAFNGAAPSKNGYYETKEERKQAWDNGDFEGEMSLGDFVDSNIDTHDLQWNLNDPRATMNEPYATVESIRNLRNTVRDGKRTIKMYRAVDADIKENSFRNGDWITPSRAYAKEHASLNDWEHSRIIEQEVSIDDIWWNGDDINEWGFDDGKGYGYKNTKNNRKLLDAVTYDDNGNVIPLSKRFNEKKEDIRFRITPEEAKRRADEINNIKATKVESDNYTKEELKEIYRNLDSVNKDGVDIEFYHGVFGKAWHGEESLFAKVVPYLNKILANAKIAYSEKDLMVGTKRKDGTTHKSHPNIINYHNYVGKANIDGNECYVRFTVQEEVSGKQGTHSFFVSDISLYNNSLNDVTTDTKNHLGKTPIKGIIDTKLQQFFEYAKKGEENSKGIRFRIDNENQEIFVSNAEKAVENIKQEKATPQQWLAMIEKNGGLKAGEDKWLGLSDWLKASDKKSITKQEILDFIGENKIQIEDVKYRDVNDNTAFESLKQEYEQWLREEGSDYAWNELAERYGDDAEIAFSDLGGELVIDNEDAASSLLGSDNIINSTRLNYTTEGLDNKREIALIVPTIESWNESDDIHFGDAGEGRAVAWVRFGETTDTDGNSVLVIDEVQSKRHQEGREKGYKGITKEEYDASVDALNKEQEKFDTYNEEMASKYGTTIDDWPAVATDKEIDKYQELYYNVIKASNVFEEVSDNYYGGIPAAPFEKNWHELAMKRMLRYAAENGFDKVAWTTGAQQAERYELGSVVDHVDAGISVNGQRMTDIYYWQSNNPTVFYHEEDGTITKVGGKNAEHFQNAKNISDIVGKELSIKILSQTDRGLNNIVSYQGLDLSVGGEGMKGFYDKMLPSFMNKYVKKWGTKVGEVTMPQLEEGYQTMHSVDVTPEMKESVMQGQVMFRAGDRASNEKEYETPRFRKKGVEFVNLSSEMFKDTEILSAREAKDIAILNASLKYFENMLGEGKVVTDNEVSAMIYREAKADGRKMRVLYNGSTDNIVGFELDGVHYLDLNQMTSEMMMYELGSIWVELLKNNKEIWDNVVKECRKSEYYKQLTSLVAYKEGEVTEEEVIKEVLAAEIGKIGGELIRSANKKGNTEDALRRSVSFVYEELRKGIAKFAKEGSLTLSLGDVAVASVSDIVLGTNLASQTVELEERGKRVKNSTYGQYAAKNGESVEEYIKRIDKKFRKVRYHFSRSASGDADLPIAVMQTMIEQATGMPIPESMDVYNMIDSFKSATTYKVKNFFNNYILPFAELKAELEKKLDGTLKLNAKDELKHKEANKMDYYMLAKDIIEAEIIYGKDRGRTKLEEALEKPLEQYVAEVEGKLGISAIDNMWRQWRRMTDAQLKIQVEIGNISPKEAARMKRNFYVPSRGFEEDKEGGKKKKHYVLTNNLNANHKFDVIKSIGRTKTIADSPFYNLMNDTYGMIYELEKTKVHNALVSLVEYAQVNNVEGMSEFIKISADGTILRDKGDKNFIKLRTAEGDKYLEFNTTTNLGEKLADGFNSERLVNPWSWWKSWFSRAVTGYNPAFVMKNLDRDIQHTLAAAAKKYGMKISKDTLANTMNRSLNMSLWRYLTNANNFGSKEYDAFVKEFFESGAATGFMEMRDEKTLRGIAEDNKYTGESWWEKAEIPANVSEALPRLALYKAMIDNGYTKHSATIAARNATINFGRRAGATWQKYIGSAIPFYNPAILAGESFLRFLTEKGEYSQSTRRAVLGLIGVVSPFILLGFLLGGDDEDDNEYLRIDEFLGVERFYLFGGYPVHLPQSFAPFAKLGYNIRKAIQGEKELDDVIYEAIGAFLAVTFLSNQFGQALLDAGVHYAKNGEFKEETLYRIFGTATTGNPLGIFFQVVANRDSFGRRITNNFAGEHSATGKADYVFRAASEALDLEKTMFNSDVMQHIAYSILPPAENPISALGYIAEVSFTDKDYDANEAMREFPVFNSIIWRRPDTDKEIVEREKQLLTSKMYRISKLTDEELEKERARLIKEEGSSNMTLEDTKEALMREDFGMPLSDKIKELEKILESGDERMIHGVAVSDRLQRKQINTELYGK